MCLEPDDNLTFAAVRAAWRNAIYGRVVWLEKLIKRLDDEPVQPWESMDRAKRLGQFRQRLAEAKEDLADLDGTRTNAVA